jgi:hypothetical protein
MNMKCIREIFTESGWLASRDEAGDLSFQLKLPSDRVVQVMPTLKKVKEGIVFSPVYSVSIKLFNDAVAFIDNSDEDFSHIITSIFDENSFQICKSEILLTDIQSIISLIINWAESVDVDGGLVKFRALPTSAKGIYPLYHLAALACNGDSDTLSRYQQSFEQGDRLEFVPYITKDMIDRAVEFAQRI